MSRNADNIRFEHQSAPNQAVGARNDALARVNKEAFA